MTESDIDPPSSERGAPPLASVIPLHTVSPDAVRSFLVRPATRNTVRGIVVSKVPPANVDDLVQDVLKEALEALERAPPAREDALAAWVETIANRVVADFLEKRTRRAKYHGPMPDEARDAERDGWGNTMDAVRATPFETQEDDEGRPEPSYDPRASLEGAPEVHAWLVRQWLEQQVADQPRDKETFEILLEHAREAKTYQQIAGERGMTLMALSSRLFEFKHKYIPRYKRWRNRTVLLLLVGAAVLIAVIALWLLRRPDAIGPDPSEAPPSTPAPSATPSSEGPFEPALPTRPREDIKR